MFCERGLKVGKTPKDFFSRQNPKDRFISHKDWLKNTKTLYLTHVQKVAPDYVPPMSGEPKIGQKLKNASPAWEAKRADLENKVHIIRRGETALQGLDKKLLKEKTRFAYDHFKPQFEAAKPRQKVNIRKAMRIQISKPNKDGSPKTLKQIVDDVGRAIAQWLKAQTEQLERMAQEAQAQALNAERERLKATPSPFGFSPSSTWGRAAQAQPVQTPSEPTSRPRYK
jgi:hypothetical protein